MKTLAASALAMFFALYVAHAHSEDDKSCRSNAELCLVVCVATLEGSGEGGTLSDLRRACENRCALFVD